MISFRDLWHRIETGVIVTFITALIWLYAEGESVRSDSAAATLRFVPAAGQTLAISPRQEQVRVTYRSSTRLQQQFQRMLSQPIEIPLEPTADDQEQNIALRDRLVNHPAISGKGIEIISVDPEALFVRVQKLTSVELPVVVVPGDVRLSGTAVVSPATVELRLPDRAAAIVANSHVEVRLNDINDDLEPGQSQTVSLPVVLPPMFPREATATPSQVEVTFTPARRSQTLTLPYVRIMVQAPPRLLGRYEIRLRDDLLVLPEPVEVVGAPEKIDTLRAGPDNVVAVLRFTAEELAGGITSKPAELLLPDGVTARSVPPRLSFQIIDHQPNGSGVSPTTPANPPSVPATSAPAATTPAATTPDATTPKANAGGDSDADPKPDTEIQAATPGASND